MQKECEFYTYYEVTLKSFLLPEKHPIIFPWGRLADITVFVFVRYMPSNNLLISVSRDSVFMSKSVCHFFLSYLRIFVWLHVLLLLFQNCYCNNVEFQAYYKV